MFRKRQLVILFIVGLLSVVGLVLAIAPGTVFELDGNSVPFNSAPPNEDWNTLNGTTGFNGSSGGSVIHTYVASENPPKIFTQGGSKDPSNTTQWVWKKADTVPDKDTIVDAFAAEYIAPGSNHEIFVFGGDRFAQNGDANIGLWFFQQQVGPLQDTNGNPAGFGPGQHQNGDVFAVSAFTNGGVNPTITVYIWDGSCKKPTGSTTISPGTCAEDNLRLKFASAQGSTCASADFGCAAVNADAAHGGTGDGSTQLSWPYGAKFGLGTNVVPTGGFFEGGLDITELFGGVAGSEPCFSSFLLETRSAQTPSAVLKDFVAGGFNTCGTIVITKACECDQLVNNTSQYEYVVSGSVSTVPSGGTSFSNAFYNVTVSDPTAGVTCNLGTVQANSTVAWGPGVAGCSPLNSAFASSTRGPSNTATVSANRGSSTGTVITSSATVTCGVSACPVRQGLELTKICDAANPVVDLGRVSVQVSFHGTVSNSGTVTLNNVNVCDDENATAFGSCDATLLSGVSLAPGASANYSGTYFPNNFNPVSPGRAQFNDVVHATASSTLGGDAAAQNAGASCVLCPPGSAACPVP